MKVLLFAIIIGLVAGIAIGALLNSVPFIDELVPDKYNQTISTMFIGAVVGALVTRSKSGSKSSDND